MRAEPTAQHRTLQRQLRRLTCGPDAVPTLEGWQRLLDAVSGAYQQADDDRYTLERSIEISSGEMRALHDELSAQARHDGLTGLPNRTALLEHVGRALAAARRGDGRVAILFIDLDGFKRINDRLGHAAGDELLIRTAERIERSVRENDVVARLGGDEFVVLCAGDVTPVSCSRLGERIVRTLEAPYRIHGQESFLSASIGITVSEDPAQTAEALLRKADLAMYRAKQQGRGLVVQFDGEIEALVERHAELDSALRAAVELEQLVLHYQPLVHIGDGSIAAYEALVRWNRPGHGLVGPDQFIPIAEEGRLISSIGRWVASEACRAAASWPDPTTQVSINLCAQELAHEDVVASLTAALQDSGLAPSRLIIELTESSMLSEKEVVSGNLARLRRLGISIAIDDFGTGYSSLSHLHDVPASILKIDRSFISDLDRAPTAPAIVGAIITMGHALGLRIVAEGVERREHLEILRSLGCDLAQGFLLARPLPAGELPMLPVAVPA